MKRKVELLFKTDQVNVPISYVLVKDYDLMFNLHRAEITERGGMMLLELEGSPENLKAGLAHLRGRGVEVRELNEFVSKNKDRCIDCGACVSICMVEAMTMDRSTWEVVFHPDRCVACGMCVDACPPGAMRLKV